MQKSTLAEKCTRSGWFAIDNHLVETAPASVGCVAWTVYTILARHADEQGRCWPSVPRIADMAGLKRRAVQYSMSKLESAGLIQRDSRSGRSNVFTIGETHARTCTPPEETDARTCIPPVHVDAQGCAPGCIPPVHVDAPIRRLKEEDHLTTPVKKTQRRAAKAAVAVEIPSAIDTEAFRAAWGEWLRYLAHDKKKPAGATVQGRQLKKLAAWGETKAIVVIDHCITNNWQGLFEPKENANDRHINRNAGPGARFKTAGYGTPGVF